MSIILVGEDFAKAHPEVVPLAQEFEQLLKDPLLPMFPRWMTPAGRKLDKLDKIYYKLVADEIDKRIMLERTQGEGAGSSGPDYLSILLRAEKIKFDYNEVLPVHMQGSISSYDNFVDYNAHIS